MEDCNTMEDSCRVCTKNSEDMRSIFEEPERLYDELQYCTGLLITKGDGLPSKICNSCLKDLKIAYKFKTTCIQAEKTFKHQKNTLIKTEIQEYNNEDDCNSAEECTEDMFVTTENSDVFKVEIKLETIKTENKVKSVTRRSDTKYPEKDETETTENLQDLELIPSGSECKVECNLCNKTFKNKASYGAHNRTFHRKNVVKCENKTGVRAYQCTQCPLTFVTSAKRHAHIRRVHSKLTRYSCRICGQKFVKNAELGQHMDLSHGVKWHTCEVCERTFTRRDNLRKHLLKQHNIHILPSSCRCRQCASGHSINHHSNKNQAANKNCSQTKQTQGPSMLDHGILTSPAHNDFTSQAHNEFTSQAHTEISAPRTRTKLVDVKSESNVGVGRKVECVLCNITFRSEKLYAAHNKTVHNKKAYSCEICGKTFSNRSSQNAHKLLHQGTKYYCDECDYVTLIKSYMVKHMQRLHDANRKIPIKKEIDKIEKDKLTETDIDVKSCKRQRRSYDKLECDLCKIKFQNKVLLMKHKTTVHGVKLYVCEICGKVTRHQSSHSIHKRIHQDPRFHCNDCDYKTCNKQDMVKHMRVHSGIKNYTCPHCPLTFSTSSNRLSHIRRAHIKLPRFYCHVCGRGFLEKYSLSSHLDSHQGIKRHECHVCETKFAQIKHLKRHLLKQHNVRLPPGSNRRRQYASATSISLQSNKQDQSSNKNSSRTTQEPSILAHNTLTSQAHNVLTSQAHSAILRADSVSSHKAQTLNVCAQDVSNSYYVPE